MIMVHGTYYGIQYEIQLNSEIDFYNDLLPIWIATRTRIELGANNRLIVIPYKDFDKQLIKNEYFNIYMNELNSLEHFFNYTTEDELTSKKMLMVQHYTNFVKNNSNLPEPLSEDEYQLLLKEFKRVNTIFSTSENWIEIDKERSELFNKIKVQRIIHNKEFFHEIVNLEKELTNQVTLSEEQKEIIEKIVNHPNLEGKIFSHSLNLTSGFY